jgi:membrane protein YdbS with pleckstrin-like domain
MINLIPGEKIIVGIRKHWFIFAIEAFGLIVAAIVPVVFLIFAKGMMGDTVQVIGEARFENLAIFLIGAWLLLIVMILFIMLTNYYLDMLVVTNQRLIDIDQISLFARDIATAPLTKIEDVKIEVFGVLATMFKFGNLHIQTAAETKEIVIRGIRYPERAKDYIMQAYQAAVATTNQQSS